MAEAELLREAIVKRVAECRHSLGEGVADLSGLEDGVRDYCKAVAAMPLEAGRSHAQELEGLMEQITALREELDLAHEAVRQELAGLSRLRQANVAYKKSDAIGPVRRRKQEED